MLESQRDGEEGLLILTRPLLWCGVRQKTTFPIMIGNMTLMCEQTIVYITVGFDFRDDRKNKKVVMALGATKVKDEVNDFGSRSLRMLL